MSITPKTWASRPTPPRKSSSPSPGAQTLVSAPAPPDILSKLGVSNCSVPPTKMSRPAKPRRKSLPSRPICTSLPARPFMWSVPEVPVSLSAALVPEQGLACVVPEGHTLLTASAAPLAASSAATTAKSSSRARLPGCRFPLPTISGSSFLVWCLFVFGTLGSITPPSKPVGVGRLSTSHCAPPSPALGLPTQTDRRALYRACLQLSSFRVKKRGKCAILLLLQGH